MEFVEVQRLEKKIGDSFHLRPISFCLRQQKRLAIAGATGSGKSTLLKMIAGLEQPDTGDVYLQGERVAGPAEKLIPGHPRIAYLSQHFELRHHYRVEELLSYANKLPYREALWIYDVCRIGHLLARKEHELSGGEKQRVATARLLIQQPALLLLDEPFSNLDRNHKQIMQEVIRDIGGELGITCLMVTHDPLDSLSWADEILVLQEGQEAQRGTPQQLYGQPASEYVAGLFGAYNLLTTEQRAAFAALLPGTILQGKLGIRPEGLCLHTSTATGVPGIVEDLYYYGSHQEVSVRVADATLRVRTTEAGYGKGQVLSVTIDPALLWKV